MPRQSKAQKEQAKKIKVLLQPGNELRSPRHCFYLVVLYEGEPRLLEENTSGEYYHGKDETCYLKPEYIDQEWLSQFEIVHREVPKVPIDPKLNRYAKKDFAPEKTAQARRDMPEALKAVEVYREEKRAAANAAAPEIRKALAKYRRK